MKWAEWGGTTVRSLLLFGFRGSRRRRDDENRGGRRRRDRQGSDQSAIGSGNRWDVGQEPKNSPEAEHDESIQRLEVLFICCVPPSRIVLLYLDRKPDLSTTVRRLPIASPFVVDVAQKVVPVEVLLYAVGVSKVLRRDDVVLSPGGVDPFADEGEVHEAAEGEGGGAGRTRGESRDAHLVWVRVATLVWTKWDRSERERERDWDATCWDPRVIKLRTVTPPRGAPLHLSTRARRNWPPWEKPIASNWRDGFSRGSTSRGRAASCAQANETWSLAWPKKVARLGAGGSIRGQSQLYGVT